MATRKENTFHNVRFITHGSQAGIALLVIVRLRFHHQFRVRAEKSMCEGFFISFSACVSEDTRMDSYGYQDHMKNI